MVSTLMRAFLKKPLKSVFDGQDPGEEILFLLRRSWWTNLGWLILFVIFLFAPIILSPVVDMLGTNPTLDPPMSLMFIVYLFWYLFTFCYFFQNYLNWFFNIYIITDRKVIDIDFNGLLHKSFSEAPLRNIEDVTSKIAGFFQMVFHVGDVYIQTAAEKREFEFHGIDNPSRIRDILSDMVSEHRNREGK